MHDEALTREIIAAAMKVHTALGPGLLESAYEACLVYELRRRGYEANRQVEMPIVFDAARIDVGYRLDVLVEQRILVELKAVQEVTSVDRAQLLSYLRLSGKPIGLLINFHVLHLKDGISRLINDR